MRVDFLRHVHLHGLDSLQPESVQHGPMPPVRCVFVLALMNVTNGPFSSSVYHVGTTLHQSCFFRGKHAYVLLQSPEVLSSRQFHPLPPQSKWFPKLARSHVCAADGSAASKRMSRCKVYSYLHPLVRFTVFKMWARWRRLAHATLSHSPLVFAISSVS